MPKQKKIASSGITAQTNECGFTLIELMVVLAMIAILALIGIPSFSSFQEKQRIKGAAEAILSDFRWARGEAVKRNLKTRIEFTSGSTWSYDIDVASGGSWTEIKAVEGSNWPDVTISTTFSSDIAVFDPARGTVQDSAGGIGNGSAVLTSPNFAGKVTLSVLGRSRICGIGGYDAC